MPVVSSYTEATLREFLATELGDMATLLGWDAGHVQIDAALVDATRLLGVTDVAEAPDAAKVERLAAVAVWRRAVKSLGARYTFATDNGLRYEREPLQKHAKDSLALVESLAAADLAAVDPAYRIRVDTLTYPSADSYAYYPDELRTL